MDKPYTSQVFKGADLAYAVENLRGSLGGEKAEIVGVKHWPNQIFIGGYIFRIERAKDEIRLVFLE